MTWCARARHGWPLVVLLVVVTPVTVLAACSGAAGAGGPPQGAVVVVDNAGASPAVTYPRSTGRAIDGAMTEAEIAKVDPVADVGRWPGEPVPPAPTTPSRPRLAAPVIPAEAREPTVEGMKKALMFYLNNVRFHMFLTGQTKFYREICPTSDPYCTYFADMAKDSWSKNQHAYDDRISCRDYEVLDFPDEPHLHYLEAACHGGVYREYRSNRELVQVLPELDFVLMVVLRHRDGLWIIEDGGIRDKRQK